MSFDAVAPVVHWDGKGNPFVMVHLVKRILLDAATYLSIAGVPHEAVKCILVPIPIEYVEGGMEAEQIRLHVFGALTICGDHLVTLTEALRGQGDIGQALTSLGAALSMALTMEEEPDEDMVETMTAGHKVHRFGVEPCPGAELAVRFLVYDVLERVDRLN
jgi:hypothetical protein